MKCEIPEFARCCFCFPLRLGLLVWAYVKLVFTLLLLVHFIALLVSEFMRYHYQARFNIIVLSAIIFSMFLCVDIVFHVIFIVSAHTKEYRKMKWFYKEAMFGLGLYIFGFLFFTGYVVYDFNFSPKYIGFILYILMLIWSYFFWMIISQAYLIMLVRSEALKLERRTNFEFTNRAVDEEAAVYTNNMVA